MTRFTLLMILSASAYCGANAQKMVSSASEVNFFSDALLEDITAKTTEAKGVLDTQTGAFLIRIPISSFQFENELMQEHFNENYMESEKYPVATFKGTIDPKTLLSKDKHDVEVKGVLTIHGVEQPRTIVVSLTQSGTQLSAQSQFDVALTDHKIEIPTIVFQKIAEVVAVNVKLTFSPMNP